MIAATYDTVWTTTPVGRAQRDLVWRDVDPLFHPGQRILDIGCGTGEDALHLMSRGVTVYGTDASAEMVEVARSRGAIAVVYRAEDLAEIGGEFDGAISNFGALNCVKDLDAVARSLATLLPSGARVAFCLLGRFCAWETLYYGVRFRFDKAFRRRHPVLYRGMTIHYPTASELRAAFAPDFVLQRWSGIGLFVPPSYVRLPSTIIKMFASFDRLLAHLPILRAMADHRLFILVRK
jgi:cyclopropane fatty-acyl-phospholipid synthase-like methyltransferase